MALKSNPQTLKSLGDAIFAKPGESKNSSAKAVFDMSEKAVGLNTNTANPAAVNTPKEIVKGSDISWLPGRKPGATATGPIAPISSIDGGADTSFLRTGSTSKAKEVEAFYAGDPLVQQWKAQHPKSTDTPVQSKTSGPAPATTPNPTPTPVPNPNQDKADAEFKSLNVPGADVNAIGKQIFDKYGVYPSGWNGTNSGVSNTSALDRLKGTNVGAWLADYANLPAADQARLKPMADMLKSGATEEAVTAYFNTNAQALATFLNIPLAQAIDMISPDMQTKRLTAIDEINKKYNIDYLANEKMYAVAGNKGMEKWSWDYIREHDTALQDMNDNIDKMENDINTSGNPWLNSINQVKLDALKKVRDDRFNAYATLVNKSIDQSAERARFAIDMYDTFTTKANNEINQAMTAITEGQAISKGKMDKIESWIKSTYDDIVFGYSEASGQAHYNNMYYQLTDAQVKQALANATKTALGTTKLDDYDSIEKAIMTNKQSQTVTANGVSTRYDSMTLPTLDLPSLQNIVAKSTSTVLNRDSYIGAMYAKHIVATKDSYKEVLQKIRDGYGADFDSLANGTYTSDDNKKNGFNALIGNVTKAISDVILKSTGGLTPDVAAKIKTDITKMSRDKFISTYGSGNPFNANDAGDLFDKVKATKASVDTPENIRNQLLEIYINRPAT